jgi:hypothetical protein
MKTFYRLRPCTVATLCALTLMSSVAFAAHPTPTPKPLPVPPATYAELTAPPVMCVEETIPSMPNDGLSGPNMSEHIWLTQILQATDNGAKVDETDSTFRDDFGALKGAKDAPAKMQEIYAAANANDMPPQILTGALVQESAMEDLSLSKDAGNWSCGIGQINVLEWCAWANQEKPEVQARIGWPTKEVAAYLRENPTLNTDICSGYFLRAAFLEPFYDTAILRLEADRPKVDKNDYDLVLSEKYMKEPASIDYSDISWALDKTTKAKISCPHRNRYNEECLKIKPSKDEAHAAYLRYLMAKSFAENCSLHQNGIPAKAYSLRAIHDQFPLEVQNAQKYPPNVGYARSCKEPVTTRSYPLAVSWVLADAVYNAGDEMLPGIYEFWKKSKWSPEQVGPTQLAASVDYAITQKSVRKHMSTDGFCESHFHIRNVINNVIMLSDDPKNPNAYKLVGPKTQMEAECVAVQKRDDGDTSDTTDTDTDPNSVAPVTN